MGFDEYHELSAQTRMCASASEKAAAIGCDQRRFAVETDTAWALAA